MQLRMAIECETGVSFVIRWTEGRTPAARTSDFPSDNDNDLPMLRPDLRKRAGALRLVRF